MAKGIHPLKELLHRESAGGSVLLVAAVTGIIVANSPIQDAYFRTLNWGFELGSENIYLKLTILKVINYLLMTIFFFIVGLEIKRELSSGHLASFRKAVIPFIAAVGGMALPAGIYLSIAGTSNARGWGVPVATDIALAVGLLAIIGKSVVPSLRTFLLGLAVIDDIGAILIIAFIYSTGVGLKWVLIAILFIILVVIIRKIGIKNIFIYFSLGSCIWYALYRSGIHPTLAGVILGLLTPNITKNSSKIQDLEDGNLSIIEWLEAKVHPWTTFLIVPLFAFANTGVIISVKALLEALSSPVAWGIFLGLVIGKPVAVFSSVVLASKLKIGETPRGATKVSLLATGSAAGIGFTVSIFISKLAFKESSEQDLAVIAVIAASLISGVFSYLLFSLVKQS